jgi:hypothetical protein
VTRLIDLHISLYDFDGAASLPRLVMGSALRSLYIFHEPLEEETQHPLSFPSLWSNLAHQLSHTTNLSSLVFDDEIAIDPYISSEGAHVLRTSYCSIPNLKHLHARPSPFDIDTLTHFSTSRTLTILEITVPSHVFEQFSSTKHIWPVYDCLKRLYIDTEDLSSAHTFLGHQGFQRLQKLELSRYKPEVVWDIPAFFASVRSSNISLNRLTLSDTVLSTLSPTPPMRSVNMRGLSLPLPFPSLTKLFVDFEGSLDLDDHVLGAMAEAWPLLQKLQLSDWSNPLDHPTRVTLVGLLSFSHCQWLEGLTLRVNAVQTDGLGDMIVSPAGKLSNLCLCRSPGLQSTAITAVIEMAFPNLRTLSYGYSREHTQFASLDGRLEPQETLYFECWQDVWRRLNNGQWS